MNHSLTPYGALYRRLAIQESLHRLVGNKGSSWCVRLPCFLCAKLMQGLCKELPLSSPPWPKLKLFEGLDTVISATGSNKWETAANKLSFVVGESQEKKNPRGSITIFYGLFTFYYLAPSAVVSLHQSWNASYVCPYFCCCWYYYCSCCCCCWRLKMVAF